MKAWQIEFVYNHIAWELQVDADQYSELLHTKEFKDLFDKQVRLNTPEAEVNKQWREFFTKKKLERGA